MISAPALRPPSPPTPLVVPTSRADDDPKPTPYQWIKDSAAGRFVRKNKVVTAIASVATGTVVAGASAQYPVFNTVANYGIVPMVGAGAAVVGAAAVHDAFVNDVGKHNVRAAVKIASGTVGVLGGAQLVGNAYSIPLLDRALTGTLEHFADNGEALLGVGVLAGGVAAARFAVDRFQRAATSSAHRPANLMLGVTSSAASAGAVLGGIELIGRQYNIAGLDHVFTNTVHLLSRNGMGSVAGGGLLLAGSGVLAQEAVRNLGQGGNDFVTVAEGMGAASSALGGLELLGQGLKIPALHGVLTGHLDTVGAVGLSAAGAAAVRYAARDAVANGLSVNNSMTGTAGASMVAGGMAGVAASFHLEAATHALLHGTSLIGGLGMGAVTAALARASIASFRRGDLANGTACAAGTTLSGALGLSLVGEGLGVPALEHTSNQIFMHTAVPFFDHVVQPAATYLYGHPIVGAAIIAASVGAYAWYRHQQGQGVA